ncbi:hypothetical protein HMPREF0043_01742 [Actinobaculum sp. oral taxon 183 str. F0552]|nr:hypothetical protein HMPREF0043_01742 [Actinobaculum sp. oral taxon 183 str. F0552]
MGSQSVRVLRRRVLGRGLREPEEAMTGTCGVYGRGGVRRRR